MMTGLTASASTPGSRPWTPTTCPTCTPSPPGSSTTTTPCSGLTLEHSSGAVEGNVNRIKMIKRQMYGRASFALLRKRVLLAT